MENGDSRTLSDADLDQSYRVLLIISLAMAGGVALFAGIAAFVVSTGQFDPFMGWPGWVRGSIAAFLIVLLAASYPLYRLAGGAPRPGDPYAALSVFQTKVIVANGVRDAVGIMGAVLILFAGDLVLGGSVAIASVVTILLSLPRKDDMRAALRGSR